METSDHRMETAADLHGRGRSFGDVCSSSEYGGIAARHRRTKFSNAAKARIGSLCVQGQVIFDRHLPANSVENSSAGEDENGINGRCSTSSGTGSSVNSDSPRTCLDSPRTGHGSSRTRLHCHRTDLARNDVEGGHCDSPRTCLESKDVGGGNDDRPRTNFEGNDGEEGNCDSPSASPESISVGRGSSVTWTADSPQKILSTTEDLRPSSSGDIDSTARDSCSSHGSSSICGRRREMEDAVTLSPSFLSLPFDSDFFAVYDGHGGSEVALSCADRLHQILAEEMAALVKSASPVLAPDSWDSIWKKAMLTCFSKMDAKVNGLCWRGERCGSPEGSTKCCTGPVATEQVGSTAVVAVVSSSQLIIANCGDSRAVLSRGGQAIPLSNDHKPDREDEMARVEAAGGRVIFWNGARVLGCLAMSRAIGDRYLKPYVISEPEVTFTQRTEEDDCLILASDGLWDVLSNEVVCDIARKYLELRRRRKKVSSDGESPAAAAAAALTKYAFDRGSSDNISVVVIDLKDTPRS